MLTMPARPTTPPSGLLPPVTVLSGFLGAGKTTVLRHLLAQAPTYGGGSRWAAIVNDVAAINIDAQLVQPGAEDAGRTRIVPLGNGCVCCSVRNELAETVAELCAHSAYDHILVETTGVAEPRAIAQLFTQRNAFGRRLGDFARLHALVTVVDARYFLDEWRRGHGRPPPAVGEPKPVFELMLDQAECADVLLLNKCDLASTAELAQVEAILGTLNPRAEIRRTEQGQIACELLLDRPRFDPVATLGAARWIKVMGTAAEADQRQPLVTRPREVRHEEKYGITSLTYAERRPFAREKFLALVQQGLPPGLLRAKGFFWLAEQPADIGFLSVAGGVARVQFIGTWAAALRESGVITDAEIPAAARARWVEPHGDRRQELVLIGLGLDETEWTAKLADCLA